MYNPGGGTTVALKRGLASAGKIGNTSGVGLGGCPSDTTYDSVVIPRGSVEIECCSSIGLASMLTEL
jgi:hypothetical protein